MGEEIILITILSLSGFLGILAIIKFIYKIAEFLESKISTGWIIENFCTEYIDDNRVKKRLYILVKNLKWETDNLFYVYKIRCFKYSIIITLLLIVRFIIIEEYNYKLVELYNTILNLVNLKISILNFNISFNDIKWIALTGVGILGLRRYYKDKIRKNVKEAYYREIIDEYLKIKDILLDIIITNMENEKVLYRILRCNSEELEEVSDIYRKKYLIT